MGEGPKAGGHLTLRWWPKASLLCVTQVTWWRIDGGVWTVAVGQLGILGIKPYYQAAARINKKKILIAADNCSCKRSCGCVERRCVECQNYVESFPGKPQWNNQFKWYIWDFVLTFSARSSNHPSLKWMDGFTCEWLTLLWWHLNKRRLLPALFFEALTVGL